MRLKTVVLLTVLLIVPSVSFAQTTRSYSYAGIDYNIHVNADSTVDVKEYQGYDFVGEYHQGWRNIPKKGIDDLTNISVIDTTAEKPLVYSASRLVKTDPASWGKYTTFFQNGEYIIEWYFDARDTHRTWEVDYKLHGAISFYKDHDELYWNLFTNYSVPIAFVEASIQVPESVTTPQETLYRTTTAAPYVFDRPNPQTFHFVTANIAPYEAVTVAVGWQKGIVSQSAYWFDAAKIYWPIETGVGILFTAILFCLSFWLWEERRYRGRGVVIAEYEPPQHLPPGMGEVVSKGHVSDKTWAATVVDLAVRGFLTITEEKKKIFFFSTTNYILTSTQVDISSLRKYEQEFFNLLFPVGQATLSLADLTNDIGRRMQLSKGMQEITKHLYAQVEEETGAFVYSPVRSWYWWKWFHVAWILAFAGSVYMSILLNVGASNIFLADCIVIAVLLCVYVMLIRPELNRQGHLLKEDWVGFKLFLEVTGKDRLQNLTPDMFEKFLPYAMIFEVEKKWAQKFETFTIPPLQWYHGTGLYVQTGGSFGGFSPSSFVSGFSASFASSFASSGGGASGGGGGAGGGGGGGGGGAS